MVVLDVAGRELRVELSDDELGARLDAWAPPAPRYATGVLAKYARLVSSASEGAVTRPWPRRSATVTVRATVAVIPVARSSSTTSTRNRPRGSVPVVARSLPAVARRAVARQRPLTRTRTRPVQARRQPAARTSAVTRRLRAPTATDANLGPV